MKIFIFIFFISLNTIFAKLDKYWWKHSSTYEIYIPTFKDSDGDGIGDIEGITSKLDHFSDLKIDAICLSLFFKTSGTPEPDTKRVSRKSKNIEYNDIIDYRSIDSRFGTLENLEHLIKEAKAKGIKVLMKMIMNSTSKKHEWFLKSEENIEPYSDYYIWQNPTYTRHSRRPSAPSILYTRYYQNAWKYSSKRKQFYYSSTSYQQPDLNLRNENVIREIQEVMEFWLSKGIAGFKLDSAAYYIENFSKKMVRGQMYQKESLRLMQRMRLFLNEYNDKHGEFERIFVVEAGESNEAGYFPNDIFWCSKLKEKSPYHFIYYDILHFIRNENRLNGASINYLLQTWYSEVLHYQTVGWSMDNNKLKKLGRNNIQLVDILTLLMSTLPGVVHLQYGQEIALISQVSRRASSTTPIMQWDDSINSGFTRNLKSFQSPVEDFVTRNVKNQKAATVSHYNMLKDLLNVRKNETMKNGSYNYKLYSLNVFLFWRSLFGHPTYIVLLNVGNIEAEIDFNQIFQRPPKVFSVEAASTNFGYMRGQMIENGKNIALTMNPNSAVVLSAIDYPQ